MSIERIIKTEIEQNTTPKRLDNYLAERFTYFSRSGWQKQIANGKVFLNGEIAKSSHKKIKGNDIITFYGKRKEEPGVDKNITILYEDEHLVAINKTGDLPVHAAGIYFNNTLSMLLDNMYKAKLYLVHRLDRETSGVILAARSKNAAQKLQESLRTAQKVYNAIIYGNCPDNFSVDTPLGPAQKSIIRKKRSAYTGAPEKAITEFKKILHFDKYSLVQAIPQTGRLHQIRAHLEYAGYPIVGDKIYGIDENFYLRFIETGMTNDLLKDIVLPRCALHALKLCFFHPFKQKELTITAPLPLELTNFIDEKK